MIKGTTFFGPNNSYWQDHTCAKCNSIFTVEKKSQQVVRHVLYVEKYRLDCYYAKNTFSIGIFKDESAKYVEAYQADFIPHVTPDNALNKVKTILIFS